MHALLQAAENIIGIFYDIHLSTSVQAIAQIVRDPNFGTQHVNLLMGSVPNNFRATDKM